MSISRGFIRTDLARAALSWSVAFALTLVVAAALPVAALAADEKEDSMRIRDGVLDEVNLKSLALPKDAVLIIRKFPADRADLGTAEKGENERRVDAATMMQREGPQILADTIVQTLSLGGPFGSAKASEEAPPENAIVVEGRFTMINPGSRSKRWLMPGTGKSGIEVEGTVKNTKGEVLAEFRHRRASGIGLAGGDYIKFLTDDTKDVGRDIAVFLKRWASGGNLHEKNK